MSGRAHRGPLPARAPPRRRRHVDRAARVRHAPGALRRGQAAGRAPRRRRRLRRALPARGAGRRPARAPQHRPGLRLRPRRRSRPPLHRHGVRRRASPCAEILRDHGRLDVAEAVDIVAQACRGLDYAHRNGVVHRDVKPGNLLRSHEGMVKLADFGIAKAAERLRHHPGRLGARHRRLPVARAGARRGGRAARRTSTRSASSPTSS